VILHEWSHKLFCEKAGIKVYEVVYFQLGDSPAGYVIHSKPTSFEQALAISFGPLVVNSLAAIGLGTVIGFAGNTTGGGFIEYLMASLVWLAISLGMHALPSGEDIEQVEVARLIEGETKGGLLPVMIKPLIWLLVTANNLRIFWFDLVLSCGVVGLGIFIGMMTYQLL